MLLLVVERIKVRILEVDMSNMRQWRCKNHHVLGLVSWNGDGVPQLMLYRHAVDMQNEHPEQVDVIGAVQGRIPVRCDVPGCDEVELWEVSERVLVELLALLHVQKRDMVLERFRDEIQSPAPSLSERGNDAKDGV